MTDARAELPQAQPNADLVISQRGGGDPVKVAASSLVVSWEVNRAGQLSGFVPVRDLNAVGLGAQNIAGRWIDYEHPTAGRWAGVVTFANYVDGVVEIAGQSFHILTTKRLVDIAENADEPFIGTPGSVFRMAFAQIRNAGPLFLTLGELEDGEDQIEVTFNAADFYETVIPQLTEDVDREWSVSADRVVTYAKRIGTDRAATVRLVEGRAILSSSGLADDLLTTVNAIRASGFGRIKKRSKKGKSLTAEFDIGPITVTNQASADRYGPMEEPRDYGYVGTEEELRRRAAAEVGDSDDPESTATLLLADEDGAFGSFVEGDTVTVELGLSGIVAEIRIINRSLDVATGVMTVSGTGRRV